MFDVIRIPAFKDNYIWLLRKGGAAVVVDPGDALPVLDLLQRESLELRAILVTHHHADHQGGVGELVERFAVPVYGSAAESITALSVPLRGGESLALECVGTTLSVIPVPGHTRGHLAFSAPGALFCGDTLFAAGCGRVFDGTPKQLYDSLVRLAMLPPDTLIYCAHEYTEANLRFAMAVEPGNRRLRQRVNEVAVARAKGLATVPSSLELELATNPFLRCREPEVVASARTRDPRAIDPPDVFAALREWKNSF